jgi:hypothetical protein
MAEEGEPMEGVTESAEPVEGEAADSEEEVAAADGAA